MMRGAMAHRARPARGEDDDRAGSRVANAAFRSVNVIESLVSGWLGQRSRERVPVNEGKRIAERRKEGAAPIMKLGGPLCHRPAGTGGIENAIRLMRPFPEPLFIELDINSLRVAHCVLQR